MKKKLSKILPFLLAAVLAGVMAWHCSVFINWNLNAFIVTSIVTPLVFLALAVSVVWPGKAKPGWKCLQIFAWLAAFIAVEQGVTYAINIVKHNAGGAKPAMQAMLPLLAALVLLLLIKPWRALGRRAKIVLSIPAAALACAGAVVWAAPLIVPAKPFEPVPDLPPVRVEKPSGSVGLSQDETSLIIQNDLVTYVITKENAIVTSIAARADGTEIVGKEAPPPAAAGEAVSGTPPVSAGPQEARSPFCYLYTGDFSSRAAPVSAALEDEKLRVRFADGAAIDFLVEARPEYIAFTLDSDLPGAYTGLVFANSTLEYDLAGGGAAFSGIGCAMTWNVDPTYYPDAKSKHVMGRVLNKTGPTDRALPGSKFAVIFAPRDQHRDILKAVGSDIARGEAAKSMVGGPNAMDSKANFGNYIIVGDSATKNVAGWKSTAAIYGIDQIDFHQGGGTFIQGSMRFTEQKSAQAFKKNIAAPLKEAGIQSGFHTYAHYIDKNDEMILADPAWQRQLDVKETFTLAENISGAAKTLPTLESTADVSMKTGFFDCNTVYILVDQEIMKYAQVGSNEFTVERGQCGTKKAAHAAGAEIRHLGGMFGMFSPDLDSELFLQIARRTAQAYN